MLTRRIERATEKLFGADAPAAQSLLQSCAQSLDIPPGAFERIEAAILKKSDGSLEGLRAAIDLSRRDWPDLLMAIGFGHDVMAHEAWFIHIGA